MTHHVVQNLPLTSKKKVLFWVGLAWPGQAKAELLFSSHREVFRQRDVSPCMLIVSLDFSHLRRIHVKGRIPLVFLTETRGKFSQ